MADAWFRSLIAVQVLTLAFAEILGVAARALRSSPQQSAEALVVIAFVAILYPLITSELMERPFRLRSDA